MPDIISIMMVAYNRLELTKKTIDNIYETVKSPFNFIIVDNASTDGTIEYLSEIKQKYGNMFLKFNKENMGIAIGRNQCLKISDELKTDWNVTIDNDILLYAGWLEQCINILKSCGNIGAIGVSFEQTKYPLTNIKDNINIQIKPPPSNLGTACMVMNKKIHKAIGFFNCEYNKYGEEDSDFSFRIRCLGLRLAYLEKNGIHLGEGPVDTGEYRKFKDDCRKANLEKFYNNCRLYSSGKKPIYIKWEEND